ncbi:hypothetical protein OXX79_007441 [Metschnikowia pulcherrima]
MHLTSRYRLHSSGLTAPAETSAGSVGRTCRNVYSRCNSRFLRHNVSSGSERKTRLSDSPDSSSRDRSSPEATHQFNSPNNDANGPGDSDLSYPNNPRERLSGDSGAPELSESSQNETPTECLKKKKPSRFRKGWSKACRQGVSYTKTMFSAWVQGMRMESQTEYNFSQPTLEDIYNMGFTHGVGSSQYRMAMGGNSSRRGEPSRELMSPVCVSTGIMTNPAENASGLLIPNRIGNEARPRDSIIDLREFEPFFDATNGPLSYNDSDSVASEAVPETVDQCTPETCLDPDMEVESDSDSQDEEYSVDAIVDSGTEEISFDWGSLASDNGPEENAISRSFQLADTTKALKLDKTPSSAFADAGVQPDDSQADESNYNLSSSSYKDESRSPIESSQSSLWHSGWDDVSTGKRNLQTDSEYTTFPSPRNKDFSGFAAIPRRNAGALESEPRMFASAVANLQAEEAARLRAMTSPFVVHAPIDKTSESLARHVLLATQSAQMMSCQEPKEPKPFTSSFLANDLPLHEREPTPLHPVTTKRMFSFWEKTKPVVSSRPKRPVIERVSVPTSLWDALQLEKNRGCRQFKLGLLEGEDFGLFRAAKEQLRAPFEVNNLIAEMAAGMNVESEHVWEKTAKVSFSDNPSTIKPVRGKGIMSLFRKGKLASATGILKRSTAIRTHDVMTIKNFQQDLSVESQKVLERLMWAKVASCRAKVDLYMLHAVTEKVSKVMDSFRDCCNFSKDNYASVAAKQVLGYVSYLSQIRDENSAVFDTLVGVGYEYAVLLDSFNNTYETRASSAKAEASLTTLKSGLSQTRERLDGVQNAVTQLNEEFPEYAEPMARLVHTAIFGRVELSSIYAEFLQSSSTANAGMVSLKSLFETFVSTSDILMTPTNLCEVETFQECLRDLQACHDIVRGVQNELELQIEAVLTTAQVLSARPRDTLPS